MLWIRLFLSADDLVDQSVLYRRLGPQEEVPVRVLTQFFNGLSRDLLKHIKDLSLDKEDFAGGNVDVGGLSAQIPKGLVEKHT